MAMVIVVIGYELIYPDSTFSEAFKAWNMGNLASTWLYEREPQYEGCHLIYKGRELEVVIPIL